MAQREHGKPRHEGQKGIKARVKPNDIRLEDLAELADNARRIEEFSERYLIDECGLFRGCLNVETLRPWTSAQLKTGGYKLSNVFLDNCNDPAAYVTYEDSLMATGEYAAVQIAKYECTGDGLCLTAAANPIFAILRVFYQGELYEKGFLPKPHGGMRHCCYSHEISPDQQIKALVALRAWQKYASPSENRAINDYLVALADYHVARNFIHPRRESLVVTPENRPHVVSILIPILWIAGKITGRRHYHEAIRSFDRILDFMTEGKTETGFDLICFNIASLLAEGLHLAFQEGLKDKRYPVIIRKMWEMTVPFVRKDGYGSVEGKKTAGSLRMPSVAPIVDHYFPEIGAHKMGIWMLKKIRDPMAMLFEADGAGLKPEKAWYAKSIREVAVTSWLLGYWRLVKMGKQQ